MLALSYSLVIEPTEDANFFSFFSPTLQGFTGVGHSIEDCIYNAYWGMEEHISLLRDREMPVPPPDDNPTILIKNLKPAGATA